MVNLENCPDEVFVPSKNYEKEERISDASLDLYVCSLAFYYLNPIERESFFQEAYRALKDDRYLILLMPRSRISPQCEKKFLQDMQDSGFEMDLELTGEYSARRSQNVETGEYGSGSGFNPYVIVARKLPLGQPEERERFVLEVGFEVVDSKPSARAIERALDISRKPRMIYSDFYRKQDALHPDVKSINQYLAGLRPRESEDLLDALARLSEELES
jgi:SAM-dependent methyltransferase